MSEWVWKPKQGRGPKGSELLYEPGNWGDVLKGAWALEVLESCLRGGAMGHLVDAYAGRPSYPVSEVARDRIVGLGEGDAYRLAQQQHLAHGRIASTGLLMIERLESAGLAPRVRAFDQDPDRRAAWAERDEVSVPQDIESGVELLGLVAASHEEHDLVLVDPYDFFDHWGAMEGTLATLAERGPVLIYHLNKAPRGAGHLDQYERLLRGLSRALPQGASGCVGRVPSDERLARGWHEMILLGPRSDVDASRDRLEAISRHLTRQVSAPGAFEDF